MSNFVLVSQPIDLKGLLSTAVLLHKPPGAKLRTRVLARLFQDQLVRPGYLKVEPFAALIGPSGKIRRNLMSYQVPDDVETTGNNYWSHIYGGGGALMQKVLETPKIVRGQNVLDLGCGAGPAAIAASMCGARSVEAWDSDNMAVTAVIENSKLNRVNIKARQRGVMAPWPEHVNVVMAGDVLKRKFLSAEDLALVDLRIKHLRMRGGTAIIADSNLANTLPQYAGEPNALSPSVLAAKAQGIVPDGWGLVVLGPIG